MVGAPTAFGQGSVGGPGLHHSFLNFPVSRVVVPEGGERSYVCSSSLADRLGAAGAWLAGASRDRVAPDPAGRLINALG